MDSRLEHEMLKLIPAFARIANVLERSQTFAELTGRFNFAQLELDIMAFEIHWVYQCFGPRVVSLFGDSTAFSMNLFDWTSKQSFQLYICKY